MDEDDEEPSATKKKSDLFNSNVTESSRKQQSISDPAESKNKQNKAKVIAELFGLEDEKKQSQQSQRDWDSSSSWLGLKDRVPAESKTPEVVTASHKTPEHGTVQVCVCLCVCETERECVCVCVCVHLLTETFLLIYLSVTAYTVCPTRYRTRHFFNNFTTDEDIAAPCHNN